MGEEESGDRIEAGGKDGSERRINFRAFVRIVCGCISFASFILLLIGLATLNTNISACKDRKSLQKVPEYVDTDNADYDKGFYHDKTVCADSQNAAENEFYSNGTMCSSLPYVLSEKRDTSSPFCYTGGVAYLSCKNIEAHLSDGEQASESILTACQEAKECDCNNMCVAYVYCSTLPGENYKHGEGIPLIRFQNCQPIGCMLSASANIILILRCIAVGLHVAGVLFPLKSMIKNKFKPKRTVIYSWLESDFYIVSILLHFNDAVKMAPVRRRKYCMYGLFYAISPAFSLAAAYLLFYDNTGTLDLILIIFSAIMIFKRIVFAFKECCFCGRDKDEKEVEIRNNAKMTIGVQE